MISIALEELSQTNLWQKKEFKISKRRFVSKSSNIVSLLLVKAGEIFLFLKFILWKEIENCLIVGYILNKLKNFQVSLYIKASYLYFNRIFYTETLGLG